MKTYKPKFNQRFIIVLFSLFFLSCNDSPSDTIAVRNATFKATASHLYLHDINNFEAADTLGKNNYHWDFGDGTSLISGYKTTHRFDIPGTHYVKLEINGLVTSQKVIVYPGNVSYQIKNESSRELDILSYVDNMHNGTSFRKELNSKNISDTLYAKTEVYGANATFLLGTSIFIQNQEYTRYKMNWIKNSKHSILSIADTTKVIKRVGTDVRGAVELKSVY